MNRIIKEKFIDYESKLLIVREEELIPDLLGAKVEYLNTYDPNNHQKVELEKRKNFIDNNLIKGFDSELQIEWKRSRIQTLHGCELFLFEYLNLTTNQVNKIKSRPFNSKKPQPVIDHYKEEISNPKKRRLYWWQDYSIKLYEERKGIWFHHLWYNTKSDDFTNGFNRSWLRKIKMIEPEIENIIEELLPTVLLDDKDLIQQFKQALER